MSKHGFTFFQLHVRFYFKRVVISVKDWCTVLSLCWLKHTNQPQLPWSAVTLTICNELSQGASPARALSAGAGGQLRPQCDLGSGVCEGTVRELLQVSTCTWGSMQAQDLHLVGKGCRNLSCTNLILTLTLSLHLCLVLGPEPWWNQNGLGCKGH